MTPPRPRKSSTPQGEEPEPVRGAEDLPSQHPSEADTDVIDVAAAADAEQIARLERENAELRRQVAQAQAAVAVVEPAAHRTSSLRTRRWVAVALVAIGALLAPIGLVSAWAERTITDPDRYLETVAPLSEKPAIQNAIIVRTSDAITSRIDVSQVTDELQAFLVQQGAPQQLTDRIGLLETPLQNGVDTLVTRVVTRFVHSDAFSSIWLQVNRTAQKQLTAILEGDPTTVAQLDDEGNLTLQLGPVIDAVKQKLVDAGLGIAASLPEINPTVAVAQSDSLVQLRHGYQLMKTLGDWLPWIALAFLVAGVLVAPRRARMTVAAALAVVVGMLLLAVGLAIARNAIVGALPAGSSGAAATTLFEGLVRFMRISMRTVAVVGLLVAVIAFFAGGSAAALAARRSASGGAGALRGWGAGRGLSTGAFGVWLYRYRVVTRWVVGAAGALVIILADTPTPGLVFGVILVALAVIGVLQLLSAPPQVEADAEAQDAPTTVTG